MNVNDLIVESIGQNGCKVIHPQTGMFEVVTGPHFHKNKKKAIKKLGSRIKREQKLEESDRRRQKSRSKRRESLKTAFRKNFSEND